MLRPVHPVHHIDLVVTALDDSLAFYRGVLEPLGYVREVSVTGERGERVVYIGHVSHSGAVGLRERQSHANPVPYDRYAVGVHHVAFAASSRAVVDEAAAWLRAHDAIIESPPREYDYIPGYYAVFFHDPDGITLEIVHTPRDPDLAGAVRELGERLARLEASPEGA
ncbi:MAG: glyoxylase family protein [Solirubrobacteraceae bacterium]|nr:glyoxylase family protein [Solirubrobacteraceae bacterium]